MNQTTSSTYVSLHNIMNQTTSSTYVTLHNIIIECFCNGRCSQKCFIDLINFVTENMDDIKSKLDCCNIPIISLIENNKFVEAFNIINEEISKYCSTQYHLSKNINFLIKMLLETNEYTYFTDGEGNTLLHNFLRSRNKKLSLLLINNNSNVNIKNNKVLSLKMPVGY